MTERPTLYDQIGGEETISAIMDSLFDNRLPSDTSTEPPVWNLFKNVRQSKSTLDRHKQLVGSFVGSIFGNPNPDPAIYDQEVISWHHDVSITPEHFDVFVGHLIEAAKEETGQHAEEVAEAIGAIALELRSVVVHAR